MPYVPRPTRRLADCAAGGVRLKVFWIDVRGDDAPPPAVLAATRAVVDDALPAAMAAEGESSGLGFVILHRGVQGLWLLVDWWAHGDICCQLLFRADPDGTVFVPMAGRPLMACVWELEVIAAERDAWVGAMMGAVPDPAAYLVQAEPAA